MASLAQVSFAGDCIDTQRVPHDTLRARAKAVPVPADCEARVQAKGLRSKFRRHRRRVVVGTCLCAVTALVVGLLVADDGSSSDLVAAGTVGTFSSVPPAIARGLPGVPPTSVPPTGATASTGPAAPCRGSDLDVVLGSSGVAAGTFSQAILLTNTAANACSLAGQPKLEVLVGENPTFPAAVPLVIL